MASWNIVSKRDPRDLKFSSIIAKNKEISVIESHGRFTVYKVNQQWLQDVINEYIRYDKKQAKYTGDGNMYVSVKIYLNVIPDERAEIENEINTLGIIREKCRTAAITQFIGSIVDYLYSVTDIFIISQYHGDTNLEMFNVADSENLPGVIEDITDAVIQLHSAGVYHGDINPKNIVIDPKTSVTKLTRFTVACSANQCISGNYKLVGAPAYFSRKKFLYQVRHTKLEDLKKIFYATKKGWSKIGDLAIPRSDYFSTWNVEDFENADVWALALTFERIIFGKNRSCINDLTRQNGLLYISKMYDFLDKGYTNTFIVHGLNDDMSNIFGIVKEILDNPKGDTPKIYNTKDWPKLLEIKNMAAKTRIRPAPTPKKYKSEEDTPYLRPPYAYIPTSFTEEVSNIPDIWYEGSQEFVPDIEQIDPYGEFWPLFDSLHITKPRHVAVIGTAHDPTYVLSSAGDDDALFIWNRRTKTRHCGCAFPSLNAARAVFDDPGYLKRGGGVCPTCGK